jgi:hypothetical protein
VRVDRGYERDPFFAAAYDHGQRDGRRACNIPERAQRVCVMKGEAIIIKEMR